MDEVFFCGVPVGCALAYGLVLDAKRHARELKRDQQGWSEYAAQRGFRYATRNQTLSMRVDHSVEAELDGVTLSCATGLGILRMPTTSVIARAAVPIEGRLYVSCDEALSQAMDDTLARRVDVSDPDFDGRTFFVRATRPDIVPAVLVPPVRKVLMRMSETGRPSLNFRCERDLVVVEWMGHDAVPELLDLGLRLVVAACTARSSSGAYR